MQVSLARLYSTIPTCTQLAVCNLCARGQDNSGHLDVEEFEKATGLLGQEMGFVVTEDEVQSAFEQMDGDNSGEVDIAEVRVCDCLDSTFCRGSNMGQSVRGLVEEVRHGQEDQEASQTTRARAGRAARS